MLRKHAEAVLGGNLVDALGEPPRDPVGEEALREENVGVAELALAVRADRRLQVETAIEEIAIAVANLAANAHVGAEADGEAHFTPRPLDHGDLHRSLERLVRIAVDLDCHAGEPGAGMKRALQRDETLLPVALAGLDVVNAFHDRVGMGRQVEHWPCLLRIGDAVRVCGSRLQEDDNKDRTIHFTCRVK